MCVCARVCVRACLCVCARVWRGGRGCHVCVCVGGFDVMLKLEFAVTHVRQHLFLGGAVIFHLTLNVVPWVQSAESASLKLDNWKTSG